MKAGAVKLKWIFLLMLLILPSILFPLSAKAMAAEISFDLPRGIQFIVEEGYKEVKETLKKTLSNTLEMFSRKLANEAAKAVAGIATKGPGFEMREIGDIMTDASMAAFGEALGTLGEGMFGDESFLCDPNPYVKLSIGLGLFEAEVPTPKCDGRQVIENYQALLAEMESGEFLHRFAATFEPRQSDVGGFLEALQMTEEKKEKAKQEQLWEKLWSGTAYLDVKDLISNLRKTSGQDVQEEIQEKEIKQPAQSEANKYLASLISGSVLSPAVNQFTNTLVSELMKEWLSGFWGTYDLCDITGTCGLPERPGAPGGEYGSGKPLGQYSKSESEAAFASLSIPKMKIGGGYDIISEFATCPANPSFNNCVIDQGFADAVYNQMTVAQAIENGFLHADWPFGYTSPLGGDEPEYNEGYPASSIKKLRSARIIPVGWEFAAEVIAQQRDFTEANLAKLIAEFRNPESDFYSLVDPDWVLKMPQQTCLVQGYGPLHIQSGQRSEWCAQTKSCILEKEDGTCMAWGYCTREKNTWRFDGQSCPEYYDTCQTLVRKVDNEEISLLKNSLIYQGCDNSNPGCYWYATTKDREGNWLADADKRIYFDRDVQLCGPQAVGCTQLIRNFSGSGTNLITNGSFEYYRLNQFLSGNESYTFYGWSGNQLDLNSDDYYSGKVALALAGGQIEQTIPLGYEASERTFTLSLATKNCGLASNISFGPLTGSQSKTLEDLLIGNVSDWQADEWTSYSLTYTFPRGVSAREIDFIFEPEILTGNCLLDIVQVVEDSQPSFYQEYGASNLTYLRKPPAYLNCGDQENRSEECDNYATLCSAEDVGCQEYTSLSDNTVIPGIVKPEDFCPAECSGYRTYKQEASHFFSEKFPLYFIASTAQECDWANVGCEEFTNLDEVAAGGEGLENYSFLRRCQKPAPVSGDCQPFYTWEGSEEVGYQLKLYQLKQDPDLSPDAPLVIKDFTYIDENGDEITTVDCEAIYGRNPGDPMYDPFNTPNCKEFYSAQGIITYRLYSDTVLCTENCHPYRLTGGQGLNEEVTPAEIDQDCIDSGGLFSQCEGITPDVCINRGGVSYNDICYNLTETQCSGPSVTWTSFNNQCRYLGTPQGSIACSQPGCQFYRGNFSGNTHLIFEDGFDGDDVDQEVEAWDVGPSLNGKVVGESYSVGYHSYRSDLNLSNTLARSLVIKDESGNIIENLVGQDQGYLISFWAKSDRLGDDMLMRVQLRDDLAGTNKEEVATFNITTDWQYYRLGPFFTDWEWDNNYLIIDGAGGRVFYIDNVRLEEAVDIAFLVRDSWQTPAVCDQNHSGAPADQYMLGCDAYQDANKQVQYLKSFSRLCAPEAVGCEALINTQNSPLPWYQWFNAFCDYGQECEPSGEEKTCSCYQNLGKGAVKVCQVLAGESGCYYDITTTNKINNFPAGVIEEHTAAVPEDEFIYLVNTLEYKCRQKEQGCRQLGVPRFDSDDQVIDFNDEEGDPQIVYFRDLPERYDTDLCLISGWGCEDYDGGGDWSSIYFKDPRDKLCEYRQTVGSNQFAWYKKDSDELCPDTPFDLAEKRNNFCVEFPVGSGDWYLKDPINGYDINQPCPWDPAAEDQAGWAKLCPTEQSSCSKFVDPAGSFQNDNNVYYFLDNFLLDRTSCNGLVSEKKGCVLFENYNNTNWGAAQEIGLWGPSLDYNAQATYKKSQDLGSEMVAPIDCTIPGSDVDYCQAAIIGLCCQEISGEMICSQPAVDCYSDDDCSNGEVCYFSDQLSPNNADDIIQVRQDRICAEWIDCAQSYEVFDPNSGQYKEVCLGVIPCTKFADDNTFQCENTEPLTDYPAQDPSQSYKNLSLAKYQSRSLDWDGYEYSGYSIPHVYPVWSLREQGYGHCNDAADSLCLDDNDCQGSATCQFNDLEYRVSHFDESGEDKGLGPLIGIPRKSGDYWITMIGTAPPADKACRSYPEQNSPFPYKVTTASAFVDANVALLPQEDVDCHYQKLEVKEQGVKSYVGVESSVQRICSMEDDTHLGMQGRPCDHDQECVVCENEPGYLGGENQSYHNSTENQTNCLKKTPSDFDVCTKPQSSRYLGWKGYCLEEDLIRSINADENDHACLTWMPLDLISGEPDVYYHTPTAEINFSHDMYYCLEEEGQAPYIRDIFTDNQGDPITPGPGQRYWDIQIYDGGCACVDYPRHPGDSDHDPESCQLGCSQRGEPECGGPESYNIKDLLLDLARQHTPASEGCGIRFYPHSTLNVPSINKDDIEAIILYENTPLEGAGGTAENYGDGRHVPKNVYNLDDTRAIIFNPAFGNGTSPTMKDISGTSEESLYYYYYGESHWWYWDTYLDACNDRPENQQSDCNYPGGLQLRVILDWDETGNLNFIDVKTRDDEGWGSNFKLSAPVIVWKEKCNTVELVAEGGKSYSHAAWTNKLSQIYGADQIVSGLEYPYDQVFEYFGASNSTSSPDDPIWANQQWEVRQSGGDPVISAGYVGPFAGSPYSSQNDVSGREQAVCVGGGSQHGKACSSASDCVDGDQQGDCFGIKPAGTRPHGIMSTASFLEIFAKTIVSYSWGGSSYQKDTTPDSDYRKIFGSSDLPVVKAAIGGGQSGWQESDQVGTLAVNGFEPELDDDGLPLPDVYEGGEAYVRLTFFAYNESGDHMPLRRIIVDWDDKLTDDPTDLRTATVAFPQGMGSPLDTAYPNFKPECQGDNFGDDAAACRESFFSVQRLYSCSPDEATDSCTNIERLDGTLYSGPCCKYKPKVVVVDNWGLCAAHSACVNGICMVPNLADDLHNNECYYDDGGMIQLRPGRYSAVYQGEIVVIPEGL